MNFGFTNDIAKLEAAHKYRDDAVNDGWSCKATYENHEALERASKLEKEGFVMMILSRDNTDKSYKYKYEAEVHIWGPDELAINPPNNYDWPTISKSLNKCLVCKTENIETFRVGFAGRACKYCLPEQRKIHEYRGWTA